MAEGENACCPVLNILPCHDTDEHKHLYCDAQHTIESKIMDNERAKRFCLGEFKKCEYYPKGG